LKNIYFYIWFIISILLLVFSWINVDDAWFLHSLIIIFSTLIVITYIKTRRLDYLSYIILAACIFSVLSTFSLYDNYITSKIEDQDGIAISNSMTYLYLGEDRWSEESFRSAYEKAFSISMILLVVYILIITIRVMRERDD
jgi:energy-coupling factor transporter transmembrane protein EcfT